jgi:5-methylcytosine-specific restriction protein A
MAFSPGIERGSILNNDQLCALFGCSPQGGMRRSLKTETLVLVSNHVASIYDDRWVDGIFHYTGMGQTGDQSLTSTQNKTLAESNKNNVGVHLFEVDREGEYKYQGLVKLAGDPYQEIQPDQFQTDRNVWVFPLKLHDGSAIPVNNQEFQSSQVVREKKAKKLSDEELTTKAQKAPKRAGERTVTGTQYERDPYVSMLTKRKAKGICELCNCEAPFKDSKGQPYLETHHIKWLAEGGEDTIENTVALCPNCHRKMHVLNQQSDREKLLQLKSIKS